MPLRTSGPAASASWTVGAGAVTGDALDGGVGPQDDPVIPVQVGENLGRLPA
jgi:hypothetical protein